MSVCAAGVHNRSEVVSVVCPLFALCVLVDGAISTFTVFIMCSGGIGRLFCAYPTAVSCHGACAQLHHLSRKHLIRHTERGIETLVARFTSAISRKFHYRQIKFCGLRI